MLRSAATLPDLTCTSPDYFVTQLGELPKFCQVYCQLQISCMLVVVTALLGMVYPQSQPLHVADRYCSLAQPSLHPALAFPCVNKFHGLSPTPSHGNQQVLQSHRGESTDNLQNWPLDQIPSYSGGCCSPAWCSPTLAAPTLTGKY